MTPAHPMTAACPPEPLPECVRRFGAIERDIQDMRAKQNEDHDAVTTLRAQVAIYAAIGGVGGGVATGLIVAAITHAWK